MKKLVRRIKVWSLLYVLILFFIQPLGTSLYAWAAAEKQTEKQTEKQAEKQPEKAQTEQNVEAPDQQPLLTQGQQPKLEQGQDQSGDPNLQPKTEPDLKTEGVVDTQHQGSSDGSRQSTADSLVTLELKPEEKNLNFDQLQALFVKSYQNHDWSKAMALNAELLRRKPLSADLHYNQGLIYGQVNQLGWAVAKFRQALSVSPRLAVAHEALNFVQRKMKLEQEMQEYSFWFALNENYFRGFSIQYLLFGCLYMFVAGSFLLVRYFAKRKIANLAQEMPPGFPVLASIFVGFFVLCSAATLMKWHLNRTDFATVVTSKAAVLSAPDVSALNLFEIVEGEELIVERAEKDFYQVLSGRGLSGWISSVNIVDSNLSN